MPDSEKMPEPWKKQFKSNIIPDSHVKQKIRDSLDEVMKQGTANSTDHQYNGNSADWADVFYHLYDQRPQFDPLRPLSSMYHDSPMAHLAQNKIYIFDKDYLLAFSKEDGPARPWTVETEKKRQREGSTARSQKTKKTKKTVNDSSASKEPSQPRRSSRRTTGSRNSSYNNEEEFVEFDTDNQEEYVASDTDNQKDIDNEMLEAEPEVESTNQPTNVRLSGLEYIKYCDGDDNQDKHILNNADKRFCQMPLWMLPDNALKVNSPHLKKEDYNHNTTYTGTSFGGAYYFVKNKQARRHLYQRLSRSMTAQIRLNEVLRYRYDKLNDKSPGCNQLAKSYFATPWYAA